MMPMPLSMDALLSPRLHPGDRVRLISPASFPDREWLSTSVRILESWDLVVEVGEHAMDQWGYMVLAATLFAHGPAPLGDHGSATVREDAHQT
jgi:hypothetical protein